MPSKYGFWTSDDKRLLEEKGFELFQKYDQVVQDILKDLIEAKNLTKKFSIDGHFKNFENDPVLVRWTIKSLDRNFIDTGNLFLLIGKKQKELYIDASLFIYYQEKDAYVLANAVYQATNVPVEMRLFKTEYFNSLCYSVVFPSDRQSEWLPYN